MTRKVAALVSPDERIELQPFLSLIRNPERLYARTMAGEFFDCSEHAAMAFLIWRRMGRDYEATGASWRRLMESNCPTTDVIALVVFHVFNAE